ncbi:hypothetical protein L6164_037319 [Bauhinia variegata]|uniref:Uncharacterized protein n=1 Tax=Bauhinia variegata TaxID=167791 RepID=A0ACB9KJS9_BAUVA|nr:hypothetical protein L6164_037319 [Bauhinia variegata]
MVWIIFVYFEFFHNAGSAGLSFRQFCNLNSFQVKFILGFSVFMVLSVPQSFNEHTAFKGYGLVHKRARWFNDMINVPFSSEPFGAGLLLLALFLDSHYTRKITKQGKTEACTDGTDSVPSKQIQGRTVFGLLFMLFGRGGVFKKVGSETPNRLDYGFSKKISSL